MKDDLIVKSIIGELKNHTLFSSHPEYPPHFLSSFFHVRIPSLMLPPMKFFSTIILVVLCTLLHAQDIAEQRIAAAERAMENDLWDVATEKLELAAKQPDLSSETTARINIMLAESFIRSNQPHKALALLDQPLLAELPETPFWRGHALAGIGRFGEAAESLALVAAQPTHPFLREAALTAASLHLSLGKPEKSIEILKLLQSSPKLSDRIESSLHQMEILIDLGEFEQARALFPKTEEIPTTLLPTAKFIDASLTLAEGNPAKAETLFTELLTNPEHQSVTRYNLAAIGKADALTAQNKPELATQSLLAFIEENPTSSSLESMFRRIIDAFPEKILSADHPTLTQLKGWHPATPPASNGLINTPPGDVTGAWPSPSTEISDIAVFSLHARAIGLHKIENSGEQIEASRLMQRVLLLAPHHFLAPKSVFTLAKWHLEANEPDQAFALLDALRQTTKSSAIRGEAAFIDAKIAYDQGQKELATSLFEEAASLLSGENQKRALLNTALTRLNESNQESLLIQTDDPVVSEQLNIELELEKALAQRDPGKAKLQLDAFLTTHPKHPRAIEARVTIIEAALHSNPPDLSLARAQLDTIKASQEVLTPSISSRLHIAELRLLDAQGKPEDTIALAKQLLEKFPNTQQESETQLILAKALFQSGSYNDARLIFEKIAKAVPGTQRAQAALLLAARSAALGATSQSRQEALALFDQTIAIDGPLRSLAILEKARLHIDLNRIPTAIESLTAAYEKIAPDDPSRLPTGLLLAEAIYARGDSDPKSLLKALEIYDQLIKLSANNPAQFFRIQYLRGLTLEKLPDPENPSENRLGDALEAYFSVLDRPADPAPPEWEWFERSGFRALTLLENAERWQAAIAIAEKIAAFGGPRAEEASTRARQLRLKHMIWED